MKREDIEKAAKKELKGIVPCKWNQEPFIDIFVRGANYRINIAWHNVSEEPQGNNELLILNKKGVAFVIKSYCWKKEVKIFGIVRWAYIKDLIPT